jgi:hypothetical protein
LVGAHEASARSSIFYIPDAIQFEVISSTADTHIDLNNGLVNGKSYWKIAAIPPTETRTHTKPLLSQNASTVSGALN